MSLTCGIVQSCLSFLIFRIDFTIAKKKSDCTVSTVACGITKRKITVRELLLAEIEKSATRWQSVE